MNRIRTAIAGLFAVLSLVLAGCAGKVPPDVDEPGTPPAPLECHATLYDGGPTVTSSPDGGPTLCPEGALEGDPCVVPLPTIDHPSGFGYRGACAPLPPSS